MASGMPDGIARCQCRDGERGLRSDKYAASESHRSIQQPQGSSITLVIPKARTELAVVFLPAFDHLPTAAIAEICSAWEAAAIPQPPERHHRADLAIVRRSTLSGMTRSSL